ncbi:MAG: glutathione peroxidase [Pseudomonadota bacterium]
MHRRTVLTAALTLPFAGLARAANGFRFDSIDGGEYVLDDWRGRPVLVVNTASLCGFTYQYDALQTLQDTYADQGLVVLAVPSDDFAQELGSEEEVAEFCEVNFNLTLPMTTITPVRGRDAHPFYAWLRDEERFVPNWNFNKVLLDGAGRVVGHYGSNTDPMSPRLRREIEALLPG